MEKIVLTGGPCAGKSTVLKVLHREFGNQLVIVPEAATILLDGGFPLPGRDLDWSSRWQATFQSAILSLQGALEDVYALIAQSRSADILVCDRGILDGAAYTPGGVPEFCRRYNLDKNQALDRYKAVIHLESLATADPDKFGKTGNRHRFESLEQAQAIELATRDAWAGHPNYVFVGGRRSIERKIAEAVEAIKLILYIEGE